MSFISICLLILFCLDILFVKLETCSQVNIYSSNNFYPFIAKDFFWLSYVFNFLWSLLWIYNTPFPPVSKQVRPRRVVHLGWVFHSRGNRLKPNSLISYLFSDFQLKQILNLVICYQFTRQCWLSVVLILDIKSPNFFIAAVSICWPSAIETIDKVKHKFKSYNLKFIV